MFFYRGKTHTTPKRSNAVMRISTVVALAAYPIGGIIRLAFPDTTPEPGLTGGEIAGFGFMILSLAAFCVIAPSHLQRIVGEEAKHLDEFEMGLRRKSYAFAYWVLSAVVVLGALYMGLAVDSEDGNLIRLWMPTTYDHWNAIFWGAILYAVVLPTTYLAWAGPAPLEDESEETVSG
jgi:hypothetical protein